MDLEKIYATKDADGNAPSKGDKTTQVVNRNFEKLGQSFADVNKEVEKLNDVINNIPKYDAIAKQLIPRLKIEVKNEAVYVTPSSPLLPDDKIEYVRWGNIRRHTNRENRPIQKAHWIVPESSSLCSSANFPRNFSLGNNNRLYGYTVNGNEAFCSWHFTEPWIKISPIDENNSLAYMYTKNKRLEIFAPKKEYYPGRASQIFGFRVLRMINNTIEKGEVAPFSIYVRALGGDYFDIGMNPMIGY